MRRDRVRFAERNLYAPARYTKDRFRVKESKDMIHANDEEMESLSQNTVEQFSNNDSGIGGSEDGNNEDTSIDANDDGKKALLSQ